MVMEPLIDIMNKNNNKFWILIMLATITMVNALCFMIVGDDEWWCISFFLLLYLKPTTKPEELKRKHNYSRKKNVR